MRLTPGQVGTVTRISNDEYLYLDDDRGGLHWEVLSGGGLRDRWHIRQAVKNRGYVRIAHDTATTAKNGTTE